MQSVLIRQKLNEFEQIVKVIQGLSCAHDHHIGDPFPDVFSDGIDLIQHLRGCQPPHQPVQSGGTEPAAHPAAHLGGNTYRISMLVSHPYTLDQIAVPQRKKIFSCSVLL